MRVQFSGWVEFNDDDVDSRSDVDHAVIDAIGYTINNSKNIDDIFHKLNLSWSEA